MQLIMLIEGKKMDAIEIDPARPCTTEYLIYLEYELMERNEEMLNATDLKPQFAIDSVPSIMNRTRTFRDIIKALEEYNKSINN
jgi:hypothetical protein